MEYNEDQELTKYIWDHYGSLMTEFEVRIGRAIFGRIKGLKGKWSEDGVPEVEEALAEGAEVFRRRVRDRLISERSSDLFVNRCPRCNCVVRTPKAQQCFWCGHSWHRQEPSPEQG